MVLVCIRGESNFNFDVRKGFEKAKNELPNNVLIHSTKMFYGEISNYKGLMLLVCLVICSILRNF